MTAHPFDKLALNNGSTLIFTPCPGTKDVPLREAVEQVAQAGAKAVITLMPNEELVRNEATDLPEVCEDLGLEWFHLPIEDDQAPEDAFLESWKADKATLFSLLDKQQATAIHCKGGSGRTGLMAAIIMLERGYSLEDATQQIKALRPRSLKLKPHTDFLNEFNKKDG